MAELNLQHLEIQIASELNALLAAVPVGTTFTVSPASMLCSSMELLLPHLLSRQHPEWKKESLDGIFIANAIKTDTLAVQFVGTCILISDQTVTPLLVDLALTSSGESIASFRVCLGEPGGGPLGISGPACNSRGAKQLLAMISNRVKDIRWSYIIAGNGNISE
jgi:hypothetical protein